MAVERDTRYGLHGALRTGTEMSRGMGLGLGLSIDHRRPSGIFIPVPALWTAYFDADSLDLSDGADVTSWAAVAGSGTLAPVANAPDYEATGFNGKPSVRFDSSNSEWLSTTEAAILAIINGDDLPGAVFAQVQNVSTAATQTFWCWRHSGGTLGNRMIGQLLTGGGALRTVRRGLTDRTVATALGGAATNRNTLVWSWDGVDLDIHENGSKIETAADIDTEAISGVASLRIGANQAATPGDFGDFRLRRLAISAVKPNTGQIANVTAAWAGT